MKQEHISVMSLEEYEPNPEFAGRNFNAGEVIQLVLKSRVTGRWLPFDYVQMVMMHELAHCKQMNHSKAFWAVRNQYAEQMRGLWTRGYTGEGLWGRGAQLGSGLWEDNAAMPTDPLPEHLCGGTYRSRRRKRKAKPVLSYQEQKERRIRRKFGAGGVALGDDEYAKFRLEGKFVSAAPRIAGSKRGRELRAAAALARFETKKKEDAAAEETKAEVDDDETASEPETESDYEEDPSEAGEPAAVDINGKRLLDGKGRSMVKVCEDENPDDADAKNELLELQSSMRSRKPKQKTAAGGGALITTGPKITKSTLSTLREAAKTEPPTSRAETQPPPGMKLAPKAQTMSGLALAPRAAKEGGASRPAERPNHSVPGPECPPPPELPEAQANTTATAACLICSFANAPHSITCGMCSHVLDAESVPNSWHCQSAACQGTLFLNAGDCGVCGVCGERRRDASPLL